MFRKFIALESDELIPIVYSNHGDIQIKYEKLVHYYVDDIETTKDDFEYLLKEQAKKDGSI